MEGSGLCAWGLHEQHVSQRRFPPGEKVAAGGGAIKQHISPNAQLTKQTWQPALYQPFSLLRARRPLGWQREMHRLERYRSWHFGGNSALNHCFFSSFFALAEEFNNKNSFLFQACLFHTVSYPETNKRKDLTTWVKELCKLRRGQMFWLRNGKRKRWAKLFLVL